METTQTKTRMSWIETLKGMGILLVVLGHAPRHDMMADSALCGYLAYLIYSFHMPLYFAISGYTFGISWQRYRETPALFVRRRARSLLVPMLSYGVLAYLAFFVCYSIPGIGQVLSGSGYRKHGFGEYLLLTLLQDNPYCVHLWYLWVLFLISMLCFGWLRARKDSINSLTAFALVCFAVTLAADLPEVLHKFGCYLVYFVLGIRLSQRELSVPRWGRTVCWAVLLVNAPIVRDRVLTDIQWAMAVQKVILLLAVPPVILDLFARAQKLSRNRFFGWLGKESFAIYLLHQPLCAFLGVLLYGKLGLPLWPVFLVCAIMSILVPVLVLWVCRRVKPLGTLAKALLNIT